MITRKVFFRFPKCETEKPIVYHLVRDYGLIINIFRAKVTPDEEGYLVLDMTGEEAAVDGGIEFVRTFNVTVDTVSEGLVWHEERCCHCGNCLSHCPTQALAVADGQTRRVAFHPDLCIECLNCIPNCPFDACESVF